MSNWFPGVSGCASDSHKPRLLLLSGICYPEACRFTSAVTMYGIIVISAGCTSMLCTHWLYTVTLLFGLSETSTKDESLRMNHSYKLSFHKLKVFRTLHSTRTSRNLKWNRIMEHDVTVNSQKVAT